MENIMKKLCAYGIISLAGMVSMAACSAAVSSAPTPAAMHDQTSTVQSVQAAADASILSTEEARTVLEAAAAAETQRASLAVQSPEADPSSTPTQVLSRTPAASPTSSRIQYSFPFTSSPPIQWEGEVGSTETIIEIEMIVDNGFFSGVYYEPSLGNKLAINGKIVESINEYELGKWEHIAGFDIDMAGTWIRFMNYSVLEGSATIDQLFLAHVSEDGEMRGVYFWNKNTFEPFDSLELFLTDL